MRTFAFVAVVTLGMTGCMNLATKPSEITGSYTSDLKYREYTCDQLGHEINSLARRENQLVTAQEQRRKSGKVQAFWVGYGTGDGIEAAELANVRGEKEAVRRAMDMKSCGMQATGGHQSDSAPKSVTTSAATAAATSQNSGSGNWRAWGQPVSSSASKNTLYQCPGPNGTMVVTEVAAAGCTVISP